MNKHNKKDINVDDIVGLGAVDVSIDRGEVSRFHIYFDRECSKEQIISKFKNIGFDIKINKYESGISWTEASGDVI